MSITKIISGGQTGADRTALEVAKQLGIPTGGTAPKNYWTDEGQDLSLRDEFGLAECPVWGYPARTEYNVRDSDGTALFGRMDSPGCKLTIKLCKRIGKPYIENPNAKELVRWSLAHDVRTLNVAGNRKRMNPAIVELVTTVLTEALGNVHSQ